MLLSWSTGAAGRAWWHVTNTSPPIVEAALPATPLRASIEAHPIVRSSGPAALASIELDGRPLAVPAAGRPVTVDTSTLADGAHVLRLTAEDGSLRRNRASLELAFTSDNTPPVFTLTFLPPTDRLRGGQVAAARLTTSEPSDVQAEWQGAPIPLLPLPQTVGSQLALLAAPTTATTAPAHITLTGRDPAGNASSHQSEVLVESLITPRQNLLVPASLAALATGPVAIEEAARLFALTSAIRSERLWSGEFRPPLAGPRTTGFGDRRDYADGHVAFHAGYDIAAAERTPVLAPAGGIVTFTGPLPQRGGSVVLDHGWGVSTVFAHLAEIRVATGQHVSQGESIGLVGSTGLSTGPHLHWEVRLRGQPVDPDSWLALSRSLP